MSPEQGELTDERVGDRTKEVGGRVEVGRDWDSAGVLGVAA